MKTRKASNLLLADVHLEIDANLSMARGHAIAPQARRLVMERHPVLNLMMHVDPVEPATPSSR